MNVNDALETFLDTDAFYGGGLANHGPMAVEALEHLEVPHWIGPFVEHYLPRLDSPRTDSAGAPTDWRDWLRPRLDSIVEDVASQAGHGLLRVAHAVRGLERCEENGVRCELRLAELGAAVSYWEVGGPGIAGPVALGGPLTMAEWLDGLGRLDRAQRSEGLLTVTLEQAALEPGFAKRVAALAPSTSHTATLDSLGAAAADAFRRNVGSSAFAILHGATVSAMASTLLAHLDDEGQRRLVAAVAAFVAAALAGFDDHLDTPDQRPVPDPDQLAEQAGATKEDHTIKFTDACISIAGRSGDRRPLAAAFRQIERPYGLE